MIDPAYKMEKVKEAHEKVYAYYEAYRLVDEQVSALQFKTKIPFSKDLYESWYDIEKSIMRFDRIFNKVEKFDARAMTDTVNHERREKRMVENRNKRWNDNYTFFFGDLTEEEQQYRDYFQSELEIDPEDDYIDSVFDSAHLAEQGQFNPALYDFQDYTMTVSPHENYEDLVEQKLFKYKYRQTADDKLTYERREQRMIDRFMDRAKNRDPTLEQNLTDLL